MTLDHTKRNGLKLADAKFLANIDEYGWVVTTVFPRSDEGDYFAYSTGLFLRFKQPEVVMVGLSLETMQRIINTIGNQMKQGVNFIPGQDYADLLDGYSCQFKVVDKSHYPERFGWSSWFYEGDEYPTLQCFWPDKNGNYPWQPECSSGAANLQPFLFLPLSSEGIRIQ